MATNYTEHYQLNQWEPTDKVLRTDFNADNAKIDGALASQAEAIAALNTELETKAAAAALEALAARSRFTKLGEWTPSGSADSYEISLANVDWSQWDKVHLDMVNTNSYQGNLYLLHTGGTSSSLGKIDNTSSGWGSRMTLFPGFLANRVVHIMYQYMLTSLHPVFYSQLTKIKIDAGVTTASRYILWGEK